MTPLLKAGIAASCSSKISGPVKGRRHCVSICRVIQPFSAISRRPVGRTGRPWTTCASRASSASAVLMRAVRAGASLRDNECPLAESARVMRVTHRRPEARATTAGQIF